MDLIISVHSLFKKKKRRTAYKIDNNFLAIIVLKVADYSEKVIDLVGLGICNVSDMFC